jgi:hypothetical protein
MTSKFTSRKLCSISAAFLACLAMQSGIVSHFSLLRAMSPAFVLSFPQRRTWKHGGILWLSHSYRTCAAHCANPSFLGICVPGKHPRSQTVSRHCDTRTVPSTPRTASNPSIVSNTLRWIDTGSEADRSVLLQDRIVPQAQFSNNLSSTFTLF